MDDELDDLLSMTRWAVAADDAQVAIRMTAPLFTYWWRAGCCADASEAAEQVAALPSAARAAAGLGRAAAVGAGMFRIARGDLTGAEPLLRRLVEATSELGDVRLHAHALAGVGLADQQRGDRRGLGACWTTRWRRSGGSATGGGWPSRCSTRGQVALQHGDRGRGSGVAPGGAGGRGRVGTTTSSGPRRWTCSAWTRWRSATWPRRGPGSRRPPRCTSACWTRRARRTAWGGFAAVAFAQGRAEPAARLIGAAKHAREVVGAAVWPGMRPLVQAMDAAVQASIGRPGGYAAGARRRWRRCGCRTRCGTPGGGHRMRVWLLLVRVVARDRLLGRGVSARKGPPAPKVFAGADVQRTIDAELPRTFDGLRVGAARCPDRPRPAAGQAGHLLDHRGGPAGAGPGRAGTAPTASRSPPTRRSSRSPGWSPRCSRRCPGKGGQSFAVDCGDEAVKVFDPPGKVRCVATPARGAPVALVVTVADKAGNYTFEPEKDS